MPPQQPGWGQQPGMPPQQPAYGQQPGWGGPQQTWAPPARKSQSSSSSRPFLVLLLFILLLGMGALAYLQTPLGATINSILGISSNSGSGTTTNNPPDTTKPVISSIKPTVAATTASITWTTNELSSTQVEYGTLVTYGSVQPAAPADDPTIVGGTSGGVVTHSVVISGLQPNTTYHYRVKSKDKAGNEAVSDDNTFTTTEASAT